LTGIFNDNKNKSVEKFIEVTEEIINEKKNDQIILNDD
jgi:hypothetical protein